ncbi:unnamed protein product [Sphagnum jensenii]|uniref:tRNA-intron lyase n=1 Tax=Sphagnum jensenii TaxID=128206 RepID=A0ABP1B1R3_9BRYO
MRRSGTRWKGSRAAEVALGEPISSLYNQMQKWQEQPLESLLTPSSVILTANPQQIHVFNRACFGRPILAATAETSSSASLEMQFLELGLEEAFFLTSELKCICIYQQQTSEGRAILSEEEVWRIMKNSKPQFVHLYKAYAHLRSKHWVVRAGLQFGADFMAYRHHPALVHSDYAVVVMWEMQQQRLNTWAEMQAMSRLCGSVAKTLLLLHIIPNRETVDDSSPLCIHDFLVKVMEVRRWFPEKNREEHCQGMSQASRGDQKTKV